MNTLLSLKRVCAVAVVALTASIGAGLTVVLSGGSWMAITGGAAVGFGIGLACVMELGGE